MTDLEKYGNHLQQCKATVGLRTKFWYGKRSGKCDCGFVEVLERAKAQSNKRGNLPPEADASYPSR